MTVCQDLAELAIEAGFEAIHGPAAPLERERTLAVFGMAIKSNLTDVLDKGIRRAPIRMYDVLRAIRLPVDRGERIGRFFDAFVVEWQLRRKRLQPFEERLEGAIADRGRRRLEPRQELGHERLDVLAANGADGNR